MYMYICIYIYVHIHIYTPNCDGILARIGHSSTSGKETSLKD